MIVAETLRAVCCPQPAGALQWGRDLIVAETLDTLFGSKATKTFNGAAT